MIDDRFRLYELRAARQQTVIVPTHTQPAALELVTPKVPSWQRPSPRAGRQLPIAYHRDRHTLRAVCRWVPLLIPLARWFT